MRRSLLCFWIGLGYLQLCFAQALPLNFQLIDATTEQPIAEAHLFVSDASLGTVSNDEGYCNMSIPELETQALIITHIAYETLVISPERYRQLLNGAQLKMQGNGVDLSEIELSAKRGNQWKKNFRRFSKVLLGEGKPAGSCEILNPEVLRFAEKNGGLSVSAIDLLQIDNDYLGYDIRFWLEELFIEADGSTQYKGNGQFIEKKNVNEKRVAKLRERSYQNSLPHFLRSLIASSDKVALQDHGYQLAIEQYGQGTFKTIHVPEPQELIQIDSATGWYQLHFPEFLTVKHVNLKVAAAEESEVSISGAEQQKFGSNKTQSVETALQPASSRLYKIQPYVLFDQRGNIINKSAVKEYGYWADQRLATTLPIDYKTFLNIHAKQQPVVVNDTLQVFLDFIKEDPQKRAEALAYIEKNWSKSFVPPLLDILHISRNEWHRASIRKLLGKYVPKIKGDYFKGVKGLWEKLPAYGSYYADFKAHLYRSVDDVFYQYFHNREDQAKIRLDEIVWGGVRQDGIPPLRSPSMMAAPQANYLADTDVVFGLVIYGQARAYPKRILAWHEFFTDDLAGRSIAGVYCTLCGTVIIYDTEVNGMSHELGTSGFLYRSNKLMYDQATQSLWSTLLGQPVLGPLVDQNIELTVLPVETTTWGEWSKKYPTTQVLSLNTGHNRNYAEGEAYKEYFGTDALMFPVPLRDNLLPNKARIFIPRPENYADDPLAIAVEYLQRKGLHQDQIGKQRILIITEANGASRVYAVDEHQFKSYKSGILKDKQGMVWQVKENELIGPQAQTYLRLPAHETFWFAWFNVFPQTRIVF